MYFLARVELSGLGDPDAAQEVLDRLRATEMDDAQRAHLDAVQHDIDAARAAAAPTGPTP